MVLTEHPIWQDHTCPEDVCLECYKRVEALLQAAAESRRVYPSDISVECHRRIHETCGKKRGGCRCFCHAPVMVVETAT